MVHYSALKDARGMAVPAVLLMMLVVTSVTAILARYAINNWTERKIYEGIDLTFMAAEGAIHTQIAEMAVLGGLWEQKTNLMQQPAGYTEYSPLNFASSNGIPSCSGVACHRDMYPTGGGLIKNFGPVNGDGEQVDTSYSITQQLDPDDLPAADLELGNQSAWTQVERLDETFPTSSSVGGSLSNSLAEGGTQKTVRYRITAVSSKSVKDRIGYSTVVAVAEMPLS